MGPSPVIRGRESTLEAEGPILRDLKRLQRRERKSLGRLVSDLLARALRQGEARPSGPSSFRWISHAMKARVDLAHKHALYEALERYLANADSRHATTGVVAESWGVLKLDRRKVDRLMRDDDG